MMSQRRDRQTSIRSDLDHIFPSGPFNVPARVIDTMINHTRDLGEELETGLRDSEVS